MTISRSLWMGVKVEMQSAISASQVISGITKANPAVATYVGADPTDGDIVLITATGMTQVNSRLVRVDNMSAGGNTFELEGVDSTNYDAFLTGSFEIITLAHNFESLMNPNASGGEAREEDATTIHDVIEQIELTTFSPLTYSYDVQWDPGNSVHIALAQASLLKQSLAFRTTFPNLRKFLTYGTVGFTGAPVGSRIVTSPLKITSRGFPQYYST